MTNAKAHRIVDLMLEIPTGKAGMGMKQARALTRDKGTDEFSHHPAQYLFKDAGDRMSIASDPEAVVAMMDEFGVSLAQVGVNPRRPEGALTLFERYPTRFFGEVGVDPNRGMESVRELEATIKLHLNMKAASAAPCLLDEVAYFFPELKVVMRHGGDPWTDLPLSDEA